MNQLDDDILDDFVTESKEHLETIEEDLLSIEREGLGSDTIHKVFRAIHSIKGGAGFMNLQKISSLSHVMETLLQKYRDGELEPNSDAIDSLLQGADELLTLFDDVAQSNEADVSSIVERIDRFIGGPSDAEPMPEADPKNDQIVTLLERFKITNLEAFEKLSPVNENLYWLCYESKSLKSRSNLTLKALKNELRDLGEIALEFSPKRGQLELLYASVLDPNMISAAVHLDEDDIVGVALDELKTQLAMSSELSSTPPKEASDSQNSSPEEAQHSVSQDQSQLDAPKTPPKEKGKNEAAKANSSVRISVDVLDDLMRLAGELVLIRNQQLGGQSELPAEFRPMVKRLDLVTSEMQDTIMNTRMQPVGTIFGKLPRIVRDLSRKLDKFIEMRTEGDDVELDKSILEALADPFTHIIRNSCDHGIESPEKRKQMGKPEVGTVRVKAHHEGGQIHIIITDDGAGIPAEIIRKKVLEKGLKSEAELEAMTLKEIRSLVIMPGFSTAEAISDVSGRGVGMDVVRSSIVKLGGTLDIDSEEGVGTTLLIRLPLTLAILSALIVDVNGQRFAIPQSHVEEVICLYGQDAIAKVEVAGDREIYRLRGKVLPLVRGQEVLAHPQKPSPKEATELIHARRQELSLHGNNTQLRENFAVLSSREGPYGLVFDRVLGTEEIVVQPMHTRVKQLELYSGATVLGNGEVALILDTDFIASYGDVQNNTDDLLDDHRLQLQRVEDQNILLFNYGPHEQFAVSLSLVRRIRKIHTSEIEHVGDESFITVDDTSIRLIYLHDCLSVSKPDPSESAFVLLPKSDERHFGIVFSRVIDTTRVSLELEEVEEVEDGLLGSSLINGKKTIFVDVFRLFEKCHPEWFEDQKNIHDGQGRKVLYAEDTKFFQRMVKGYLKSVGFEVDLADDGAQAFEMLKQKDYDLLISDIEMPNMNGWELVTALRQDEQLATKPALALTALCSEESRQKTLNAGFDHYEVKVEKGPLLRAVFQTLSLIQSRA